MAGLAVVPGHRDPFDLMLAAQAVAGTQVVVTGDEKLADYPVTVMRCSG